MAISFIDTSLPTFELVGQEEIVYDYSKESCEYGDYPDTPARAFRDSDGIVNLISSEPNNYRMIGSSLNTVKRSCDKIMASAKTPEFNAYTYSEWLSAPYTEDGINIYNLVHNEWYAWLVKSECKQLEQSYGWVNAITMAVSNNKGAKYSHPADYRIIIPVVPWNNSFGCTPENMTRYGAMNPTNIVKKDGYYYSLFSSVKDPLGVLKDGTCIMRTQNISSASSWEIWTDAGWDSSETAVCKPLKGLSFGNLSLTFNKYLNKYIMLGMNEFGVYFILSEDLFSWILPTYIYNFSKYPPESYWYPSLLDPSDNSRNFEFTGREAYIYFTKFNGPYGSIDRDLMRQKIRFTLSPLKGDINLDGSVDVLDVQACVNHILGLQNYGSSADVNGDGSTDVLDVQAIVNEILTNG